MHITEIAETTAGILIRTGLSREEADRIVTIIQRFFKDYLEEKKHKQIDDQDQPENEEDEEKRITQRILEELDVDYQKLENMAVIIQQAYRNFKERQKKESDLLFGMVDWRVAARSAIRLYRKTGATYYEVNRAATLIKAAYKGYYTRRIMRRLLERGLASREESVDYQGFEEEEVEEQEYYQIEEREEEGEREDEEQGEREYEEQFGEEKVEEEKVKEEKGEEEEMEMEEQGEEEEMEVKFEEEEREMEVKGEEEGGEEEQLVLKETQLEEE